MLYIVILIIVLTIILYLIYKDYLKVLKVTSIVTTISGILTFIVGYFIKYFMNSSLKFINISEITNIITSKFVLKGIYLLIIGLIEFFIYFTLNYIKDTRKLSNQQVR